MNFTLLGEDVVFRTTAGSKLEAASARTVVAFEVDDMDPGRQTGWSVLIQGRAALIEDPVDLARAVALPLQPWAPAQRLEFVRIRSELVSGRRIPQPALLLART
ncbi:MAG: pyridoxamine 5'-phosphate oxidase family protein [Acidimicrobiales bacterium]